MRELAVLSFQTLDGVMHAPQDWGAPYWDDVMEHVGRTAMADPYDVLLGRNTYQAFASNFTAAGDDHPLNKATKFVVTSTLNELEWKNSVRITGDVVAEVSRLKQEDGPLLQVHGSWKLIQTLLSHALVDEYRLWTFPVLVGSGKRLFAEGTARMDLKLARTEPCSAGAVMSVYRPT